MEKVIFILVMWLLATGAWPVNGSAQTPLRQSDSAVAGAAGMRAAVPRSVADSLAADSAVLPRPLVIPPVVPARPLSYRAFIGAVLDSNSIFSYRGAPLRDVDRIRPKTSRDGLFYAVAGLFLLLAVIRLSFSKYFTDMFRAFFNATLSQRQLKDQLSQTPFPAFLLNIFFSVVLGMYLFLILRLYNYIENAHPLYLVPAFMLLVAVIYLFKYLFLRISGWLFGNTEVLSHYIFILYLINKVMGVVLLPFLLVLAFSTPPVARAALYISITLIVFMIGYLYLRAYGLLRGHIYFSKFHFFLYLCAFEIAPVLIIGKLVLIWLNGIP